MELDGTNGMVKGLFHLIQDIGSVEILMSLKRRGLQSISGGYLLPREDVRKE